MTENFGHQRVQGALTSIFEHDLDDDWKRRDLNEMDEFDLGDWRDNACCPDAVTAARRWCGCGGSGSLPEWVRRTWEVNA